MAQVSVIIPSHNVRDYVGACLESILAQTHPVEQIIVIDDSTDDTAARVEPYVTRSDGRVELHRVPPCNVSQARNQGLAKARGDLVAYLDADDLWMPDKIEQQVRLLEEHPDACGSHTRLFLFREQTGDEGGREWDRVEDDPSLERILMWQAVPASTVLVRRRLLEDIEFDPSSGHGEDTVWAADLRLKGPWRCVDAPVTGRRLHATQVTRSAWHTIHNTNTRVRWVRSRAAKIGTDEAARLEEQLWVNLVSFLERRYWRRQFEDFHAMRDEIRKLCPDHLQASFINDKRVLPRWMYAIADRIKPRQQP
ncbi:MAG: glycosyltransferase family 2 protein [Phycisphaeraceae bacterium]|nr:glycosyltransferase family 2 protein [Phycisphaeraceae bacterium]